MATGYISSITLPDNQIYDIQIPLIIGTQTGKTGTWLGNAPTITSLYDGLTIKYFLNRDPDGNATLNLTLADGSKTGNIACYYNSGRLSTHYAVGSIITLTYFSAGSITINGTATTNARWIADANYDSNSIGYTIRYNNGTFITKTALNEYKLLLQFDETSFVPASITDSTGTNKTDITQSNFLIFGDYCYYASNTVRAANEAVPAGNTWLQYTLDLQYSFNTGTSLTTNKDVYLVAKPNNDGIHAILRNPTAQGNNAKATATGAQAGPITQTLPSSDDGFIYIRLGHAYSTSQITLTLNHPVYWYKNDAIREYSSDAATVNGLTVQTAVPEEAVFTDTIQYHTSGTWGGTNNLKYTATSVNNADELSFTLATASTSAYGVTKLSAAANNSGLAATAKSVYDLDVKVDGLLATANAMTFKGVVNTDADLPVLHEAGDTYRVGTAGEYRGKYCEIGTLIICVTDRTTTLGENEDDNNEWTSVETNEDGAVISSSTDLTDNAIVRYDGNTGRIIQKSGVSIDDSNNVTIPGTIYFSSNTSTTTGKPLFSYNASYTKFGIWYKEGTPDVMAFSASGNGDSTTSADFAVEGGGKLYNLGKIIPHTGNNTGSVGGTNGPVYVDGGQIKACTTYANATVAKAGAANLTTTQNALAFYTNTTGSFGNASKITVYNDIDITVQNATKKRNGLYLSGICYGNTAADLTSNTAGVMRYEDGGVRIEFGAGSSDNAALLYTNHDSANTGGGASFHFVGQNGSNNTGGNLAVTAPDLVARRRMAVGYNFTNASYGLIVNGATLITGNTEIRGNVIRLRNSNNDNNQAGSNPYITSLLIGDGREVTFDEYNDGSLSLHVKKSIFIQSNGTDIKVYDSTKTYAVNDIVWYNKSYYVCTTAITTAETWTSEHWRAISTSAGNIIMQGNVYPLLNGTNSLGTSSYKWSTVYGITGNFSNITIGGSADVASKSIASASTLYLNRAASTSIIFQLASTNVMRIDTSNAFRPETNNTLSIGTSDYKWASIYATTYYGAINQQSSTGDLDRPVWFCYKTNTNYDLGLPGYNTNFMYNPSTGKLQVGNTTTGSLYVGTATASTAGTGERQIGLKNGSGRLYLYAAAAVDGNKGLYSYATNQSTGGAIITINQSNQISSIATITGTLTLSKTTDASGIANNSPALIVGGAATSTHLEFDANEIMAKATGTTTADLYINADGNAIILGKESNGTNDYTKVRSTLDSSSTSTGALRIAGGVGIAKTLYVGTGANITGKTIIDYTTASSTTKGSSQLQVMNTNTTAGNVAIELRRGSTASNKNGLASWQIGVESGVFHFRSDYGDNNGTVTQNETYSHDIMTLNHLTGVVNITSTAASSSASTGALIIGGGIATGAASYLTGSVHITGTAATNPLFVRGIAGSGSSGDRDATAGNQELYLNYTGGKVQVGFANNTTTNMLKIAYTTVSSSTSTGALVVDGGAGIAGTLYVGTGANITGQTVITRTDAVSATGESSQLIIKNTTAANNVGIELIRGSSVTATYTCWQMINKGGYLQFMSSYDTNGSAASTAYNRQVLKLYPNTGNADLTGIATIAKIKIGTGTTDIQRRTISVTDTNLIFNAATNQGFIFQENAVTKVRLMANKFYPETTNTGSLGQTANRWGALYVGTADSYGNAYTPVYWNEGVPAPVSVVRMIEWTFDSGSTGTTLSSNSFTTNTIVIQIVVHTNESNLTGPISWQSNDRAIILSTTATSGTVGGYIIVAEGLVDSSITSNSITPTSNTVQYPLANGVEF